MKLTDEMLMAFADGELADEDLRQVAAAVAADPALAARVAAFEQSRKAVAAAFGAFPPAPVPDPIAERIRAMAAAQTAPQGANVVPMLPRKQPRSVPFWQLPLAASIALAIGVLAGQQIGPDAPLTSEMATILDDPHLKSALSSQQSGSRTKLESGADLSLIASFVNANSALCREFEYDLPTGATTVAVACRTAATPAPIWDVQLAVVAGGGAGGYAPASSLDTLDAWLTATGAGAPLGPEAEAAALRSSEP